MSVHLCIIPIHHTEICLLTALCGLSKQGASTLPYNSPHSYPTYFTLVYEATCSPETLLSIDESTWCHNSVQDDINTHRPEISNLLTIFPMKLVVIILVFLNVKWDQPMQQVGKCNTSRYSVKVYEFSTFCKCNLGSNQHSSAEISDIFHCHYWMGKRGVPTCTITWHVKCPVVDFFQDIFVIFLLFALLQYFIFLEWNSIHIANISSYVCL